MRKKTWKSHIYSDFVVGFVMAAHGWDKMKVISAGEYNSLSAAGKA